MKQLDLTEEVKVGIADCKIARSPQRIVTLGLGSCVGITLFDPIAKIGGMAHIMLPDSTQFTTVTNPFKFADLAIPILISQLKDTGAAVSRLKAKIAGGAQMFSFGDPKKTMLNIGERNVCKVREVLKKEGIPIVGEDVGGNIGRTMILETETGKVFIRSTGKSIKEI